ncbi:MAG: (d)CMP kinase [Oscillospiraceae bacterium]|nr:(d)CMP kinase [Oscillospiraceae bacterium]
MISIAIDGPAGAGKSTISRLIAKKLNILHVDTGALYRAIGLYIIRRNISLDDVDSIKNEIKNCKLSIKYIDKEQRVFLFDEDVSDLIRTLEVSKAASIVSAIGEVRDYLLDFQRNIAKKESVVMDGRDIGTVVLKDADFKIFLEASVDIRAKRRYDELLQKGEKVIFDDVLRDIEKRDFWDSTRKTAPLLAAKDAIVIDTSNLSVDESVKRVVDLIKKEIDGGL